MLTTGYIFFKNTKRKGRTCIKSWLKNCLETSEFNNIFEELMLNDKEELR